MNELELKRLNSLPADPRAHVPCDELGQQHQFTAWAGVAGRLERWCLACARRELACVVTALPDRVDLTEIDRQRAMGWPDFHPEDYCHRCGARNVPSWFTDSTLFNEAFGPPETHPHNGIVCPACFVAEHERLTGRSTTWELRRWPSTAWRYQSEGDLSEGGAS